jgi:hypothetical protein
MKCMNAVPNTTGLIGGASFKLAYENANVARTGDISQYEYTTADIDGYRVNLSKINGQPFVSSGITIQPSHTNPLDNCVDVICRLDDWLCLGVCYRPEDNATHTCPISTDLVVEILCEVNPGDYSHFFSLVTQFHLLRA